jgi:DNA-binding PadR family transcriptional regulator
MAEAHISEFEALIGRKRAALALVCLHADGPMRWTDIRDGMSSRGGAGVGDKAVTRALRALQRLGLAEAINGVDGNHLYALTPRGTEWARWVEEVFDRLDHHERPTA